MKTVTQRTLACRLVGAVLLAFAASMVFTWMLHERMTRRAMQSLFDNKFNDVAVDIRERVDERMLRQAMALRDKYYEMREEDWWNDPDESCRRLRALARELGVDEICIVNADGLLTHSARREEVGALLPSGRTSLDYRVIVEAFDCDTNRPGDQMHARLQGPKLWVTDDDTVRPNNPTEVKVNGKETGTSQSTPSMDFQI